MRGLSAPNDQVVWVSGTRGTFIRTADGGKTWRAGTVPGTSALDFRDVHAFGPRSACLLSIGPGEQSRIYKTTDGKTWSASYVNNDPQGFLDAIAFWDADHGLALGDPVQGKFVILTTDDAGATWSRTPVEGMPAALQGEGAFAASGTCLVVGGETDAWFATGGAHVARVFRSTDRGRTWTAHDTPVDARTLSSGIFSLAFHDRRHGIAVGGDYKNVTYKPGPAARGAGGRARDAAATALPNRAMVALTDDGGRTWRPPTGPGTAGYRSAVAYVPGTKGPTVVAVGPAGSDVSRDGGEHWSELSLREGFNAVQFVGPRTGWAVGDLGAIARFDRDLSP